MKSTKSTKSYKIKITFCIICDYESSIIIIVAFNDWKFLLINSSHTSSFAVANQYYLSKCVRFEFIVNKV